MKTLIFISLLLPTLSFSAVLNCAGTEPFWGLKIDTDKEGMNTSRNDLSVKSFKTTLDGEEMVAVLIDTKVIGRTSCSDGMSDVEYRYEIILSGNGSTLSGCCQ